MDEQRVKLVDAFIAGHGIISRSRWGARLAALGDADSDWDYTTAGAHHSGRRGHTDAKVIESLHRDKNGWSDVGYHFMIGPAGQIYEGRRLYHKGSHVENANTGKIGILVMGKFEREFWGLLGGTPADAQIKSFEGLVRALKTLFGTLRVLGGHKDFKVKTECPGNQLYPMLPGLRKTLGMDPPGT